MNGNEFNRVKIFSIFKTAEKISAVREKTRSETACELVGEPLNELVWRRGNIMRLLQTITYPGSHISSDDCTHQPNIISPDQPITDPPHQSVSLRNTSPNNKNTWHYKLFLHFFILFPRIISIKFLIN